MLGSVDFAEQVIIADLEAGIGTLTRLADEGVDVVVVVVEPTAKSIEVGQRAAALVREKSLGRLVVVANRVRGEDDMTTMRAAFPDHELVRVPEDPGIAEADRRGSSPLDSAPDGPGVRALAELARHLVPAAA